MSIDRISWSIGAMGWTPAAIEDAAWRSVTDRVKTRWKTAKTDADRQKLQALVLRLLDTREAKTEALNFLRSCPPSPQNANALTMRLIQTDWTPAVEAELFALLKVRIGVAVATEQRIIAGGQVVRALTKELERMRYKAMLGPRKSSRSFRAPRGVFGPGPSGSR